MSEPNPFETYPKTHDDWQRNRFDKWREKWEPWITPRLAQSRVFRFLMDEFSEEDIDTIISALETIIPISLGFDADDIADLIEKLRRSKDFRKVTI